MRTDTGATTAGGNLIWTATVPAFPLLWKYSRREESHRQRQHHEVRLWVNQVVTARVNSSQRSATTALQNAVSYFPEFNYESFWRLLDRISISSSSSRLEFQKNEYSTYNRRTHFTPIWYPDGSYTVNTWVIDCWTPAGMLSVNLTDSLNIRGNLWDDWHIAPLDL